ncbi:MAG: ABC transporter substrate-binding protein [Chloroflexi bacterium]|nr:ABC transporter substrate-binding protein [Chloroflexota bacterium]
MITARIVITALAGLTLVLLAACRPSVASDPASTAPATVQFIVPVAGSLANLPMYIARTQGFWKKQNITMELVAARGGGPDLAAVAAGEVQFDVSAGTYVGVASGAPIIAVMNVNKRSIANVVIRKELADQLGVSMGVA